MNQAPPSAIDDHIDLPLHLRSYDLLAQHVRANLADLSTTEKGDRFAHFASKVIPQTNIGSKFDYPELNPLKASDEGVDLLAQSKVGNYPLFIQSKLWVDRAAAIDSVVSQFEAYYRKYHQGGSGQLNLFPNGELPHFMLITLSPLTGVLKSYHSTQFSSKTSFIKWEQDSRIHFIDGYEILRVLQTAYRKLGEVPVNLNLRLASDCIQQGNVYLGVISSHELRLLYDKYGDSLFFENIRDFLGVAESPIGRTTPNAEIVKTLINEPDKLLERNNGIVVRADGVELISERELFLSKGSVVNGCQTMVNPEN